MSKHFCFCIPVRFGVFLFSFLSFAGAAFSAAVGWFLLHCMSISSTLKFKRLTKSCAV